MKWYTIFFVLLFVLPLFLFFTSQASAQPSARSMPTASVADIDTFLKNSVLKRLPKGRKVTVREFPMLQPWHRMTDYLTFDIDVLSIKTQDPNEAIELSLPYLQAYVDAINNVREVRPYLMDFPMNLPLMNFVIGFATDEKTHRPLYEPYISSLRLTCGKLTINRFYRKITFPNGRTCTNAHDNVYDQSKGLPESVQKLAIPRFDQGIPEAPISIPPTEEYRYLNGSQEKKFNFLLEFARQNNLIFLALEAAFPDPIDRGIFAEVAYAAQETRVSLDEARQLALKIQKEYGAFIHRMGWLAYNVNKARKEGQETLEETINAQRYMGFRVSFWDKYIDRVKPPAIAEFRVYGTKACYYTADEYQRLQLIHQEEFPPFEVATPLPESLGGTKK